MVRQALMEQSSAGSTPLPRYQTLIFSTRLDAFFRPYSRQVLAALVLLLGFAAATVLVLPLAFRDLVDFSFGRFYHFIRV